MSARSVCALPASSDLSGTDASDVLPGYRKVRSGRHIVFFRSVAGGVEIVRILHERMDARGHLD